VLTKLLHFYSKVHFAETMEVKNGQGDSRDIVCMPKGKFF